MLHQNLGKIKLGSKIDVVCARVGEANTTQLFFSEFSAAYFAKRNLNGDGFQSEGAAEGGVGGIPPLPRLDGRNFRRQQF